MTCISSALIVGGGIAGLATAIALARVGVRCDVVEVTDVPQGASLALSGRAAEALDELGVYEQCHSAGTPFTTDSTAADQRDSAGRLISAGPQRPQWPGAKTSVGMYRPALLQILADSARSLGVNIRVGTTTETIDDRGGAVVVTLSDGTTGSHDLVIGADGVGSTMRSELFPEAPVPTYSGQMSLRWMAPGPAIEGEGWYLGPLGRLGFYYLPQGLVYMPAVISSPEPVRLTKDDLFEFCTELLDSYTAPAVVELRRRLTPDANLIYRPFEWILLPEPWHRGRVVLIGDSAHATTAHMGMGGGMALEDAVVLGQCMAIAPTLDEALAAFTRRRFERVRTVVETSVAVSRLEQEGAPVSENVKLLAAAFETLAQPY